MKTNEPRVSSQYWFETKKKKKQQQDEAETTSFPRLPHSLFRSHFGPLCYWSPSYNFVNCHDLLLGNDFYTNRQIRFARGEMQPTSYFSDLTIANDLLPAGGSGEVVNCRGAAIADVQWLWVVAMKNKHIGVDSFVSHVKIFIRDPSQQNLTESANVVRYSIIFPLFFILDWAKKEAKQKENPIDFLGAIQFWLRFTASRLV